MSCHFYYFLFDCLTVLFIVVVVFRVVEVEFIDARYSLLSLALLLHAAATCYASRRTLCTCGVGGCGEAVVVAVTVTSADIVGYLCATIAWIFDGGGVGDFLDRFSGCWESAMSTCNSSRRGEWADGEGRGGETDVECGDWK